MQETIEAVEAPESWYCCDRYEPVYDADGYGCCPYCGDITDYDYAED